MDISKRKCYGYDDGIDGNGDDVACPNCGCRHRDEIIDVEKETARTKKEKEKLEKEIAKLKGKLSNEGFLKKAPENVVAAEREKLQGYEEKAKSLAERLGSLTKLA